MVDGPVRGREHLPRVLGFIKSHQIAYLEPRLHGMVGTLGPGERTPVFLIGGAGTGSAGISGCPPVQSPVVRHRPVGVRGQRDRARGDRPGSLSQAVLPRFASEEFKDPRAPQNLYPVGALEKELRRRLGHPGLVYRALRQAAHAPS